MATTATRTREPFLRRTGSFRLWFAVFAGPFAWFGVLCVSFLLPYWACMTGHDWVLDVLYAAALAVGVLGLLVALRIWRATGGTEPGEAANPMERSRFLAALGVLSSALFSLVILAQWIMVFVLSPCQPTPRGIDSPDAMARGPEIRVAKVGVHRAGSA